MKKSCELCNREARMYCDSDQASLCWDCDERVHTANFIVAKHSRNLLCHVCQSTTEWKASGSKFGPTFSICQSCFNSEGSRRRNRESEIDGDFDDSEEEDEEEEEKDDDDDLEEDGENQVVPWTIPSSISHPHPPPNATTSSSEIGCFSTGDKEDVSSAPDEEEGCCSIRGGGAVEEDNANAAAGRQTGVGRSEEEPRMAED